MPIMPAEPEHQRKLFIGGLTYSTTDDMLKEYYEQWGEIVDCIVMREPGTRRSRGFGFVTYSKQDMLEESLRNRPHMIDGKEVEPKRAVPRDQMANQPEPTPAQTPVKRLYVSGIKEEHNEGVLRDYFGEYGNVTVVEIIPDRNTGQSRGFAFITFDEYDSVDKCVAQRSHMICGKRCDVKKAIPKDEIKKTQTDRDRMARAPRSRGSERDYGGGYGGSAWGAPSGGGAWNQQWNQTGYGYGGGYGQPQSMPYGGGYGGYQAQPAYGGGGYGSAAASQGAAWAAQATPGQQPQGGAWAAPAQQQWAQQPQGAASQSWQSYGGGGYGGAATAGGYGAGGSAWASQPAQQSAYPPQAQQAPAQGGYGGYAKPEVNGAGGYGGYK